MKRWFSLRSIACITVLIALVCFNWAIFGAWPFSTSVASPEPTDVIHLSSGQLLPGRHQDCGIKSLYLICKAAGKQTNVAHLRRLTNTTSDGTTMLDLKNAALALGFDVEACELSFPELRELLSISNRYAILHSAMDHFFPAVGVSWEKVRILDPAIGLEHVGEHELTTGPYRWAGKALLLRAK